MSEAANQKWEAEHAHYREQKGLKMSEDELAARKILDDVLCAMGVSYTQANTAATRVIMVAVAAERERCAKVIISLGLVDVEEQLLLALTPPTESVPTNTGS
jgi:hypothetical protein